MLGQRGGVVMMDDMRTAWQERRLEEILMSGADPVTKVRHIMGLGFAEEVERYELGQRAPVYYERLDFEPAYEPDEEELHDKAA
jgi:hypothetical protein